MRHKPIPWAIALTGVLYFGLLIYWQSDELSSEIAALKKRSAIWTSPIGHLCCILALVFPKRPARWPKRRTGNWKVW